MSKYMDIHFRLSKEEKEVIEQAAKAAGKKLSEYVRDVLLAASDYAVTDITYAQDKKWLQESDSGVKDIHLDIRVSKEEMEFYTRQADLAECSISEYVRKSARGNEIYVIPGLKDVAKQIAKLGVNLNQLTLLAHQGKIREVDLFSCNDSLKQILRQLMSLNKKRKG